MLVFVNLPAGVVLLFIKLSGLSFRQVAIVGGHVSFFLIVDALFLPFDMGSLAGSHRAILYSIGDAILLILLAGVNFVYARMSRIVLSRSSLRKGCANRHQTTHR